MSICKFLLALISRNSSNSEYSWVAKKFSKGNVLRGREDVCFVCFSEFFLLDNCRLTYSCRKKQRSHASFTLMGSSCGCQCNIPTRILTLMPSRYKRVPPLCCTLKVPVTSLQPSAHSQPQAASILSSSSVMLSFQECYINGPRWYLTILASFQHSSLEFCPDCCMYQQFIPF